MDWHPIPDETDASTAEAEVQHLIQIIRQSKARGLGLGNQYTVYTELGENTGI